MASKCISQHAQLRLHSITASKRISKPAQSRPWSAYLSWLDLMVSKCISKHARFRSTSVSLSSLDLSLLVHLQACSITAANNRFKEWRQVYRDTGVMEVDRVTANIFLADRREHRPPLISIPSHHTMKIHTLSFPTFGLTRSVRDFVDPQRRVVSYHLTWFLRSSNQNRSFSWSPFGCPMGVSRCSSDYARVPSAARLTVCIYIERLK